MQSLYQYRACINAELVSIQSLYQCRACINTELVSMQSLYQCRACINTELVSMQSSSIGVVYRVITSLTNMYHDTIKKHTPEYDPKVEIKVYRNVYGLVYGAERHFQQYFSHIVTVSFIGGGNRSTQRKPSHYGIPPLLKNNNLIFNDLDKANEFNNVFAMQTDLDDFEAVLPELTLPENQLCDIEISETDIEDALSILNPSKASGPDLINPRLLKEAVHQLKCPLCKLFILSLSIGVLPSDWKKANVTPVYKNNNPNDVKHYRPISLLSVISKCMERYVYKYVHNFLLLNNIITSNQYGFTFGDSAINQLVNISNDFGRALDSGKGIRVVFCDISKAFDRVWHKGLLFKLKQY
jgi:hypothetical protein